MRLVSATYDAPVILKRDLPENTPIKFPFCPFLLKMRSFFPSKTPAFSLLLVLLSSFVLLCLLLPSPHGIRSSTLYIRPTEPNTDTSHRHLIFGIASSARSWPSRSRYVRIWWPQNLTRGYVFLDRTPPDSLRTNDARLPPLLISADTSRFPYTFHRGFRSAIRVARIVADIVRLDLPDVRWIVLGDDDTVFVPHNLVKVLSKYDYRDWIYVGMNSESVEQNAKYSFDMAFGGGGFAISYPLARVLARVLDSCLVRYSHLYGSDARVYSCLAELGVGLIREPGFHQVDIRGDLFGLLSAHPLAPLVSLHHVDNVDPIFPNMNRTQALEHLFKAIEVDPGRILHQTVCYDRSNSLTISVSWGYSVQIFEGNVLLPDLLSLQRTFTPWKRSRDITSSSYMFKTKVFPRDPCMQPAIFFLGGVVSDTNGTQSYYGRHTEGNCLENKTITTNWERITVFSPKLVLDIRQLRAPRRHCCDVLPSSIDKMLEIGIRKCNGEELISMHL